MTIARLAHLAVALMALAGLTLHYSIILGGPGPLGYFTLRFASYFTNESNALIAVAAGATALGSGRLHRWATRPSVRVAITLYILVVALIFHAVLANMVPPGRAGSWGNLFVHSLVPLGWTLCWLAFPPHGGIDRTAPLRWILFPLGFAGWALLRGAVDGWYPYFFLDAGRFGYPMALLNIAVIGLVFLALGYALRWIDGVLGKRR